VRAARFTRLAHALPADARTLRAWWVPGRIEVFGKHTDYAGGRSLLCTVTRAIHVVARARDDAIVTIHDLDTDDRFVGAIDRDLPSQPGSWRDYPVSVLRRLARDFPGPLRGVDLAITSTLPRAAGLSSSSALVIATFLPLAAINDCARHPSYRANITNDDELGAYLGAVENGKAFGALPADRGVGTQGGSQDQIAILRSRADTLVQYRYLPVAHERSVTLPPEWTFVIGVSGVHAEKGGAVQAHYNALAAEATALLAAASARAGAPVYSLLDAPAAPAQIEPDSTMTAERLSRRHRQFATECTTLIPGAADAVAACDAAAFGALAAESFRLADDVLKNQLPATRALVQGAHAAGALAASAFGAGFGGAVWALVTRAQAAEFSAAWSAAYASALDHLPPDAEFFATDAGPPASEL
jgi:galactokinase